MKFKELFESTIPKLTNSQKESIHSQLSELGTSIKDGNFAIFTGSDDNARVSNDVLVRCYVDNLNELGKCDFIRILSDDYLHIHNLDTKEKLNDEIAKLIMTNKGKNWKVNVQPDKLLVFYDAKNNEKVFEATFSKTKYITIKNTTNNKDKVFINSIIKFPVVNFIASPSTRKLSIGIFSFDGSSLLLYSNDI